MAAGEIRAQDVSRFLAARGFERSRSYKSGRIKGMWNRSTGFDVTLSVFGSVRVQWWERHSAFGADHEHAHRKVAEMMSVLKERYVVSANDGCGSAWPQIFVRKATTPER